MFAGIPFVPYLVAMGIGYGLGELISLSVNRKRGTGLARVAGGSVVLAFLISWFISPFSFVGIGFLFRLLIVGIGVYMAVQRVR